MPNEMEKSFVKSFLNFLNNQIKQQNSDVAENIEIAIQRLEAAYDIQSSSSESALEQGLENANAASSSSINAGWGGEGRGDSSLLNSENYEGAVGGSYLITATIGGTVGASSNPLENIDLFELFQTAAINVTQERKEQAVEIKNEGNRLMKELKYHEALQQYNRAILLDATNAVFYCNRAAAYTRIKEYNKAISDCRMSLLYNPNYSKAHGRIGIAYSYLQKYEEAIQAYLRALELEPNNRDYKNNLRICEERLQTQQQQHQYMGEQLLQDLPINAELRNLITDMMNNPMIFAASRQLVIHMANDYPDFISGFRQLLRNFASAVGPGVDNVATADSIGNLPGGAFNQQSINQPNQQQQQQQQPQSQQQQQYQHQQQQHQLGEVHNTRRPIHQRQPPPPPPRTREELIQQMVTAAGAAPHYESIPPSDGPHIRNRSAPQQQNQNQNLNRPDGGGDHQN